MFLKTKSLSNEIIMEVNQLVISCCHYDHQTLSYPLDDSDMHYLFYDSENRLISILGITDLGDALSECSAFTLPDQRRQGYFSRLLEAALTDYEEHDIIFACDPACADTIAVLAQLGAELESHEHQMEYCFTPADFPHTSTPAQLFPRNAGEEDYTALQSHSESEDTLKWQFYDNETLIGSCLTTQISDQQVCLHQLLIADAHRRKGYGRKFLKLLFAELADTQVTSVVLQVSGDNQPALALYTKTGFQITGTLSYYCY